MIRIYSLLVGRAIHESGMCLKAAYSSAPLRQWPPRGAATDGGCAPIVPTPGSYGRPAPAFRVPGANFGTRGLAPRAVGAGFEMAEVMASAEKAIFTRES
jgi:hypothetical protein